MEDHKERRAFERRNYQIPIEISFVRDGKILNARSLNHCERGMCFESTSTYHSGATLTVRVKDFHPHGPCIGLCEGLRSITLAEVKWCTEIAEAEDSPYRVGIQFFAPVY
jgi:hypothetical protein